MVLEKHRQALLAERDQDSIRIRFFGEPDGVDLSGTGSSTYEESFMLGGGVGEPVRSPDFMHLCLLEVVSTVLLPSGYRSFFVQRADFSAMGARL